jgi:MYXO-CTERM domain-containing protein
VLHEVDGRAVLRASVDLVARLVPGDEGTTVTLGLRRPAPAPADPAGDGPLVRVALVRRPLAGLAAPGAPGAPGAAAAGGPPRLITGGIKSYGTAETQTPPATPDGFDEGAAAAAAAGGAAGGRRRVVWQDPPASERVFSSGASGGGAAGDGARPVYVTVRSA